MNIYYTAKDIEEMAAQGIQQLEICPGVTLTDFARETARQLNITLIKSGQQAATSPAPKSAPASTNVQIHPAGRSSKYNKPSGCMHGSNHRPATAAQATPAGNENSNTVNRLIDLMGNVMKRGG